MEIWYFSFQFFFFFFGGVCALEDKALKRSCLELKVEHVTVTVQSCTGRWKEQFWKWELVTSLQARNSRDLRLI